VSIAETNFLPMKDMAVAIFVLFFAKNVAKNGASFTAKIILDFTKYFQLKLIQRGSFGQAN